MDKNSTHQADWKTILHSHGLRATSAIVATLQCLESSSEALSHDEITLRLADTAPDRVTLYRILDRLDQTGLVKRYTDSHRLQRFAIKNEAPMGSFECDRCHHVIPIELDPVLEQAMQMVKSRLSQQGMEEREITLASYGLCSDCNIAPQK
ncbi:Fur family transcriptional regulator [Pantoea sp. GbtcB22]|uniref:Fur family transcriptional regulator n=1 Tax=Pantoea sp. GbtcB22 TaxID=2824767 RepID=UPI001C30DF23|nr:transcriptional repressor [Pantoea sp. GbtcB22]